MFTSFFTSIWMPLENFRYESHVVFAASVNGFIQLELTLDEIKRAIVISRKLKIKDTVREVSG